MAKREMKTTHKQIVEWAQRNLDECGMGSDADEFATRCWRCGYDDKPLERCHVIPHSLGGKDEPSNYRLLCGTCHLEAPNVADPKAMDNWIRETSVPCYNRFWHIREVFASAMKKTSWHFGQKMNDSTKEWINNYMKENLLDGPMFDGSDNNALKNMHYETRGDA